MIFILIITILCFTQYRNDLFSKILKVKELFTEEEEEEDLEDDKNNKNNLKKKKTIKSYPISGNISSKTNNKITSTGENTIDDPRLVKLKNILRIVALKGRKQVLLKSLSNNKEINYAKPIIFNKKNLQIRERIVYPNEIKPIMDYILNQINTTKMKSDDTYHKLRLIKLNENDIIKKETKDEVKYTISFIAKYYSNFFNNKKNKRISKIDDIIFHSEIIGKKKYLDDVFITSLKAGKNVKLLINQLEITGIYSKDNYLSGYDSSNGTYKLLDNFNVNKSRNVEIDEPIRIKYDNDDHSFINLQNYKPNKKTMVKINSNYQTDNKKSYLDSIDSLLPDSYKEPDANNNLLTEESETNYNFNFEEEEEEEYDIDSVNVTSDEAVIKPDQIVIN